MSAQDILASVAASNVSFDGAVPVCTGTTTSTTPIDLAVVPLEPGASMLAQVQVIARRPDTGASKAWAGTALIKRVGSTVTIEEATGGAPADAYCSAGDTTGMAGCTIALASVAGVSDVGAGVRCTGPAAVTVVWAATLRGTALA
jgi:hypothetical protein